MSLTLNLADPRPHDEGLRAPAEAIAPRVRELEARVAELSDELARSQEQLLVAERMASLGRVAAGIAHEINSPLGSVLNSLRSARGFVEEYRASVGDPDITPDDHKGIAADILATLELAESAVQKVVRFVRSIKTQTRSTGEAAAEPFDPAREVDATVILLQHELQRRRVAVFTEMERGHRLVGDPGKFGLVVQNLLSNALDAYGAEGGEVWVRVHAAGKRLLVSVEDRGCGIPEEIRARVFEYLFTTKEVGRGTGLGLALVSSVVGSHFGGEIALQSEVGRGTTFTLSFPFTPSEHGA